MFIFAYNAKRLSLKRRTATKSLNTYHPGEPIPFFLPFTWKVRADCNKKPNQGEQEKGEDSWMDFFDEGQAFTVEKMIADCSNHVD